MPFVLETWLKAVPENAVIFCQLTLILSMMYQITIGTMTAVTSVGNIKAFQIAVGAIEIFNLPVAYLLMKAGLPAYFVLINSIFFEFIAGNVRIWYAHKIAGLNIKEYLISTMLSSAITVAIAVALAYLLILFFPASLLRAAGVMFVTSVSMIFFGRFIALTSDEYKSIRDIVASMMVYFKNWLKKSRKNE
jgi:hypothetical protein